MKFSCITLYREVNRKKIDDFFIHFYETLFITLDLKFFMVQKRYLSRYMRFTS